MAENEPKPGTEGSSATVPAVPGMTYRAYLAERDQKLETFGRQSELLDKSLLTLSGGALGLILTFLHDHTESLDGLWWAIAGMVLLGLCLLITLVSIMVSQESISTHIDALDAWCRASFAPGDVNEKTLQKSRWVDATDWLNRLAIAFFIIGLVFVATFVTITLANRPTAQAATQGEHR